MTVRKGLLRLSRSQVRVLPGAPTAWSEPHSDQATRTRIVKWSTNGPHCRSARWTHRILITLALTFVLFAGSFLGTVNDAGIAALIAGILVTVLTYGHEAIRMYRAGRAAS